MYKNNPFKKQNWYVFGKPVYAPASGMIVESQNTIPDNEFIGKIIKSPDLPGNTDPYGMGNHVIIDHGNGEYSVLLHMEKGSVKVKTGQMITKGQQIGNVGFSGDAIFPHMHYTVMSGVKEFVSEGIPSYFNNYKLYRGSIVTYVKNGHIDSGDIIESDK
jgi:murein DD-endopeptidase MepM/ murein hydrolase activator NlpD